MPIAKNFTAGNLNTSITNIVAVINNKMASFLNLLLLLCYLLSLISLSAAKPPIPPKALILPVFKDQCTQQYITKIHQRTPLVPVNLTVDLGGRALWTNCEQGYISSSYKFVSCDTGVCAPAGSHACITQCAPDSKPGSCYNNSCEGFPENKVAQTIGFGPMSQDVISLPSFNGKNPDRIVSIPDFAFVCAATSLLEDLADTVTGMAGLGNSKVSMPVLFSSALGLPKKFSICLSSSPQAHGAIFFGDRPFIIPNNLLTYTPIIQNPRNIFGTIDIPEPSTDHYISVLSIRVGGKDIKVNKTLLSINGDGRGGTKISTLRSYTVLHTSIYKALVKAFVKQISSGHLPEPLVPISEPPYGACFPTFMIRTDENGRPSVPFIDLVLVGGVNWRITGPNSMVKINSKTTCLGFVDGGLYTDTSIVIGGHQIEDNLLQFDLASSTLGFTSSLLSRNISCSIFT